VEGYASLGVDALEVLGLGRLVDLLDVHRLFSTESQVSCSDTPHTTHSSRDTLHDHLVSSHALLFYASSM
jgi:hypothetical protein